VVRDIVAPRADLAAAWLEAAGLLTLPRLGLSLGALNREPAGDGSLVLVLPGFGVGDASTWPLRTFLANRGYRVRGWGLGTNRNDVPTAIAAMARAVADHAAAQRAPVSLVGWSLGGYIAREVAREQPEAVRRVVTLGSPVIGGPRYTSLAGLAPLQGWDLDFIEAEVERRKAVPLRVPVTAVYSRRDGIVAWQACIDPENDAPIEHVEVTSSHLGLGVDPDVYRIVARRLALPAVSGSPGTGAGSTPTA
jgi:pimeloyl-ACP methyl ester carboxylesterase